MNNSIGDPFPLRVNNILAIEHAFFLLYYAQSAVRELKKRVNFDRFRELYFPHFNEVLRNKIGKDEVSAFKFKIHTLIKCL